MQRLHKYEKIASSDPARYETWKLSHNCNLNYAGSFPGMETAGATKIFVHQKWSVYYTSFYGHGDSKAYPAVKDIYGPSKSTKKFDCVTHYQKRVCSRFRNLKKEHKRNGKKRKTQ